MLFLLLLHHKRKPYVLHSKRKKWWEKKLRMDEIYRSGRSTIRASFWNSSIETPYGPTSERTTRIPTMELHIVLAASKSSSLFPLGCTLSVKSSNGFGSSYYSKILSDGLFSFWSWWTLESSTGLAHQGKSWANRPKVFLLLVKWKSVNIQA